MKKINSKKLKFKLNNTVVLAFVIVCVILLNVIIGLAEVKFPRMTVDLTQNSLTQLTNETKVFLKELEQGDDSIEIICLKGTGNVNSIVSSLLGEYEYYCDNLKYSEVNYHSNPTILSAFNISSSQITDGTVIVTNADKTRYRAILPGDMWSGKEFLLENKVTNAISYIKNSQSVNVCIATGYGSDDYISDMVQTMIDDNLTVSRIDLSTTYIPDGIDVLMIMSPLADLTENEIKNVDSFVSRGGNLVVALPSYAVSMPNLESYLKYWGVSVGNDLIYEYEETSSYEQSGLGFFAQIGEHSITEDIKNRILVTNARSLKYTPTGDLDMKVLLSTSNKAVSAPQNVENITKEDLSYGPFEIGYIIEKPLNNSFETTSKLIVTSTAGIWGVDTISNLINETRFGNRQLIVNAISYASGKTVESVWVPKKTSSENIMTISTFQSVLFTLVLCVVFPVIVLLCGVVIWLKRRNK